MFNIHCGKTRTLHSPKIKFIPWTARNLKKNSTDENWEYSHMPVQYNALFLRKYYKQHNGYE